MPKFEKGDEVRLKSGGPVMTVEGIGDYSFGAGIEDGVVCIWFEGAELKDHIFDAATLVKHSSHASDT